VAQARDIASVLKLYAVCSQYRNVSINYSTLKVMNKTVTGNEGKHLGESKEKEGV
jgi:hypothetical protein